MAGSKRRGLAVWLTSGLCAAQFLAPAASWGETLQDAIRAAYDSNPTLGAQRFRQRTYDEQYVQARAGLDPTISLALQRTDTATMVPVTATFSASNTAQNHVQDYYSRNAQIVLSYQQPLYNGGQTAFGTSAARATVLAGRSYLGAVESQVVLQAIQAYMSVLRYQNRVRVSEDNLKALTAEYEESVSKQKARQGTLTDVAQAEGRRRGAEAQLISEKAQLSIAVSQFTQSIGHAPGDLAPPPALRDVPQTLDEAFDAAEQRNPLLKQARFTEEASRARIDQAKGVLRPLVSANFDWSIGSSGYFTDYRMEPSVAATLSLKLPLYSRAQTSSVRQQIAQNGADRMAVEEQRRAILQSVAQSWSQLYASRSTLTALDHQVDAFYRAYEGMRKEEKFGLRSRIEVLNSEQEFANAELTLYDTRYGEYVAQAALLYAMGGLTAESLDPTVSAYKPDAYFRAVRSTPDAPWTTPLLAADQLHLGASQPTGPGALDEGARPPGPVMPPAPTQAETSVAPPISTGRYVEPGPDAAPAPPILRPRTN